MGRKMIRQEALEASPIPVYPKQRIGKVIKVRGGGVYEVAIGSIPLAAPSTLSEGELSEESVPNVGLSELLEAAATSMAEDGMILVEMPPKFRKVIWVKLGNYVLIEFAPVSSKVIGEIQHVFRPEHIKDLKAQKLWPQEFEDSQTSNVSAMQPTLDDSDSESEDDDLLFQNPNRRPMYVEEEDDDDEDDDDDYDEDESEEEEGDEAEEEMDEATKELNRRLGNI
ncbi:hypothetical protein HDV05_005505 [Chytridiales sp. JEL 0842]|nr:hypothetical protein HDV05_005505 [Chytridiales sp. JEL 0842]